ncbi:MAG: hypothetical protein M1824_001809 [Vezdaea acicularis]|nr:MAG: hypothetical protein M1824_001809 [Vezdaea acicularis]
MSEPRTLKSVYRTAETLRKEVENSWDTNSSSYQSTLASAISNYEACSELVANLALFSPNETADDISSSDLQYLLIDHHLANLHLQRLSPSRRATLLTSQNLYSTFLSTLSTYELLSPPSAHLYTTYLTSPLTFSTAPSDPALRRAAKINRFREEKDLKAKLAHLSSNPAALDTDDEALRELHLHSLRLATHQSFQALESIAQELQILSLAPPADAPLPPAQTSTSDDRDRNREGAYSERLDPPLSSLLNGGPLLDKSGKPLQPFTLLDSRTRLQQGVFRPGHNLPTMTIDEYLEEERRRGGIIDGGGEASGVREEVDEDDVAKADEATMKARQWDEFTEANPRGAGNTMNMG